MPNIRTFCIAFNLKGNVMANKPVGTLGMAHIWSHRVFHGPEVRPLETTI